MAWVVGSMSSIYDFPDIYDAVAQRPPEAIEEHYFMVVE
jgi:hypothetical protein